MLRKKTETSLEKTSEQPIKPTITIPASTVAVEETIRARPQEQAYIKPTAVLLGIVGGFIGHWMGGTTSAAVIGPHIAALAEGAVLDAATRRHRR